MQNNDNTRKLYDALVADNYELGDYDKFTSDISNPEYMRKLYDTMVADDYELGEYNTFSSRYNVTPQGNGTQQSKVQPVVDAYDMPMQPEVSTIEDAPKVEEKPQENLKSDLFKPQSTETPSLLDMDTQRKDYFAEAGAKAMEGIRQERQAREYQEIMKPLSGIEGREQKNVLEERKKQIEAQLNQPDAVRNAAARTNMAKALENVDKELQVLNEQQKQWQEQYGSWTPSSARRFREQTMEQTWYDPYAVVPEEYKALATQKWGKEGSEDAYFSAWMNLSPEEREAFVKREHIKSFFNEETANRMQGIRERALEEKGRGIAKSAVSPMGYSNSAEAAMDRMTQDAGNIGTQTLKALDKAEEIKQAYKNHQLDENFFAGAYKGMKDGLADIDNWTGLYMVGEMNNLYDIADKMEKGEALTQTEEDFLDAQAYKLAVEAALADDLGWGYSSGNVTGASIPFMLQMLVSPIGGASGKAIDKGFAAVGRRAIDKFGKGILKKLLTKAPVKKIAKGLVGTVGKGIGQTILFGSDRVAAGTMERHLGNEMVAERANEEFNAGVQGKAGEDLGTALFKAGVSTSMENISEFAGGAFIDDFTKMVGKKISKEFMDAMGGSVGRRMAKAAARQNANKVFRAIANNKWGQHAVNLSKSVQSGMEWDGLLNEYLEEVLNNASNVMIGDMSMEDFTSLEKNAETLLGLAWTSGFFMANNAASRVGGYARGNIALKRTDRAARQIFTGDMQEKWDAYTQALSQADGYEEVEQLYKGLMTDISKNQDKDAAKAQMSEATAYMVNYVKMMGMNAATEEADEEEQKTPAQKEVETAQGEGIAAQGTEEELDVVEEMDESYNQLAGHLEGTNVEEWLLQYGETADKQMEAIRGSELDEQTKAMAEAYLTSAQRYEGLLLANQEEVDAIVEEAAKEFDANVNQELGSVIQVLTAQGKTAYVIQGNPNEREDIRLRYEDGTTEPVSHVVVEKVLNQADAQTMRSDMIEGVRKTAVAEVVKRMQGAVPNATQMQMPAGHNVVVDGQAGVVAGVNADGTMQIQMQGGNVVNAAPQQVMDAQAYNTIMERKARARESARVSVPVREEVAAPVAEEAAAEAVAAEAVAEEAIAAEEELTEAQKLLQEYMDESVSLEDRQAIVGNNVAQAKQAAMEAQAEVDAMAESKPKATDYTSIAEFKQAQEQWKAQMQEKQQALDLARQQEATWNEVQKGMVQPVETATEQTSAEAVPATPQVTEVQRAEAKNHNSKHDTKALAKEIGVSAKRIQRVIDFANQVGVKLNFANVTRTQGNAGAFTNADNIAKERTITLSKYQLAKGMAIEWVMGHELTHQIKADGNAANWEAYKQAIINALGQDAFDKRVKDQSKVYREAGAYRDMSANAFHESMVEEVCADAAGDMLLNPDNMNKVMGVPQSLASRIWNGLKNMVTFSTPTRIKQAVDAWQMLAGGKELTGEADGREEQEVKYSIPKEPIGRSLAADEAEILITDMKENADIAPELEFSIENWLSEFGKDGLVTTPIGKVKMGENQIAKLLNKNREKRFGLIRPTLQTPDVIIEKHAPAEGAERESKFLFIKTFVKPDGSRFIHFESVTVLKDGMDVSISSHEIGDKALRKEMQNGTILHLNSKLSSGFDKYLTKTPTERPDLAPTSDNRLVISSSLGGGVSPISHADDAAPAISLQSRNDDELSASKDTQSVSTMQTDKKEISEKSAESNVEVTNEEVKKNSIPSVNSMTEAAGRLEENVGEVDTEKGDVRYSVHDILRGKERENAIKDLMTVTGRSRATVLRWLKAEESLAKVILDEDNVALLDIEADESVPSIWNNSDYPQGTVEFSNICKKRLPFTTIYQRLQKEYPNMVFDAQTLNTIRETMKDAGKDVACALCFVEDRRQLLGEIGQGFIDAVQGNGTKLNNNQKAALNKLAESGDRYVPNLYDILTLDGMKKLRKEHPAVAQAFIEYNNARGMQAGRLFQAYSAYNREILKYSDKKVKSINDNGGLRIFSFSDFEAHHLIDLVQVLTDCAAKGIKVQGYTKVPAFAKAVKDTGAKINRSLIPKGVGYVDADYVPKEGEAVSPNVINGKRLLFDTIEGIDVNDPNFFDSTSSKSVGNILVVINDEHARIAMADPFVDYLIGFHTGQAKDILKGKGIDTWVNYKNDQMDKIETTDNNGNRKLTNAPNHGINIYTDVLNAAEAEGNPIKTAKQFTERFLEECNKRGYVPRFYRFLNRAKDGRFLYTPGYHKFLPDFKLFDKNGKILTQEPVMPIFDNEFNKQILEDYVRDVKEELPLDDVYEAVKEAIGLDGKKFSISAEEQGIIDAAKANGTYMKAPNGQPTNLNEKQWAQVRTQAFKEWFGDWENDPENASKVVDENGEPMVVYHYTPNEFTEFDTEKIGSSTDVGALGRGFYFSPSDKFTLYGDKKMALFVNAKNPMLLNDSNAFEAKEPFFKADYKWDNESAQAFADDVQAKGYDAVYYENRGMDEIVAFRPTQIKSATDNVGTFDAENADIRYSMPGHSVASRIYGHPFTGAWQKFLQRAPKGVLKPGYGIIDESRLPEFADWYRMLVPEAEEYKEFVSLFLEDATAAEKKHVQSVMDRVDKIVDDYRRLAEGDNSVLSLENNARFSITPDILAANERFNEELDEYIKKGTKANFVFHIGQPLGVMKLFFPELPIVMRPRVINKASNTKHDVDAASLYNLPQYIAEPIFVFQREDGAIGILTEMMDNNGKNVCVAVELNKKIQDGGTYLDVNDIRSIHGRDVKNIVLPIIHNNTLKYADKEKALDWFSSASSIYQQEITSQELSDATKIVQDFQNPPLPVDESSQNVENAKSEEQKYSLPARPAIPKRNEGEGIMEYAQRVAAEVERQRAERVLAVLSSEDDSVGKRWRSLYERVRSAINGKNIRSVDKRTLNAIMRVIGKGAESGDTSWENEYAANFPESVRRRMLKSAKKRRAYVLGALIDSTEEILVGIEMRAVRDRIDDLLNVKTTAVNQRGIETGKGVDAETQKILGRLRETMGMLQHHKIEDEMHELRSQNWHIRNDAQGEYAQGKYAKWSKEEREAKVAENKERLRELKTLLRESLDNVALETVDSIENEISSLTERIGSESLNESDEVLLEILKLRKMMAEYNQSARETMALERDLEETLEKRTRMRREKNETTDNQRKEDLKAEIKNLTSKIRGLEGIIRESKKNVLDGMNLFADNLESLIKEGRENLRDKIQAELQRRTMFLRNALHDVGAAKDTPQTMNTGEKDESRELGWFKSLFANAVGNFDYMLQKIATRTFGQDSWLYRQFMLGEEGVMAANTTFLQGLQQAKDILDAKAREIFGKKYKDVMEEHAKVEDTGVDIIDNPDASTMTRIRLRLSKGQATYVYMLWKMADGRAKLLAQGFDEEIMAQIEEYIGIDLKEWADWIQDEYLPDLRVKYNERYREMFNTDMAAIESYVPIKINGQSIRENIDLTQPTGNISGLQTKNGSLIKRVANVNPIDLSTNAMELILDHVTQMEEFYAYAPVRRDLQYILSSQAFRNRVNANSHGDFARLLEATRIAVRANKPPVDMNDFWSSALSKVQKGLVAKNIAYRAMTAIKQVLAVPGFYAYSQNPRYMWYLTKNIVGGYARNFVPFLTMPLPIVGQLATKSIMDKSMDGSVVANVLGNNLRWCLNNIPDFRDRVLKNSAGDIRLEESSLGKSLDKFVEVGMSHNVFVDALTVSVGLKSIYDYEMYRAQERIKKMAYEMEMDNEWKQEEMRKADNLAKSKAILYCEQTQQSGNPALLSPMQTSRNFLLRSVSLYKNSNLGFVRKFLENARDIARYMRKGTRKAMVDEYARLLMLEKGLMLGEAKKQATNYCNSQTRKAAISAAMYGYMLNLIWEWASKGLLGLLVAEDDDEGKPAMEDVAEIAEYAFMPLSGIPFMDWTVEFATEGRTPVVGLTFSQIEEMSKEIKSELEASGVGEEVAIAAINHLMRFGGVDLEVFANSVDGWIRMMEDTGNADDKILALMLILNSPKSNRISVARELYKGESEEEFQRAIELAGRYNQPPYMIGNKMTERVLSDMAKWYLSDNASDEEKQRMRYIEEMEERIDNLETVEDALKMFDEVSDTELRKKISSKIDQMSKPEDTFAEKADRKKENALAEDDTDMGGYTYMKMADSQDLLEEKRMRAEIDMLKPIVEQQKELFEEYGSKSAVYTRFMAKHGAEIRRYNTLKAYSRAIQTRKRKMDEEGADVQALYEEIKELYNDARNV